MLALYVVAAVGQSVLAQAADEADGPPFAGGGRTGVVVSRRIDAKPAFTAKLAEQAAEALRQANVPQRAKPRQLASDLREAGITDASRCNDTPRCVAKLARSLKLDFVVAIAVTQVSRDVAVSVSAVDRRGQTLLRQDFVFSRGDPGDVELHFKRFAEEVRAKLYPEAPAAAETPPVAAEPEAPTPPPLGAEAPASTPPAESPAAQTDRPVAAAPTAALTPADRPPPLPLVEESSQPRPLRTAVGITAIAAGVAGATFAVLGVLEAKKVGCMRRDEVTGANVSCMGRADAAATAQRANTYLTVAVSAGGAAVGMTGLFFLLGL